MKQILISVVFALLICVVIIALTTNSIFKKHTRTSSYNVSKKTLFEWGHTFAGSGATSKNVHYNCTHNGQPICCDLLTEGNRRLSVSAKEISVPVPITVPPCAIKKVYVPSPYETRHMEIAAELNKIIDFDQRKDAFIKHVRADVNASNIWLDLVHQHMQSESDPPIITPEHMEYMSRFEVTKTCTGAHNSLSASWIEWIEPLSIHARHPFALDECKGVYEEDYGVPKQSSDHVLVHFSRNMHDATTVARHNPIVMHRAHLHEHRATHLQTHNYFFDAGTSTFDSSIKWFLCAYLQRKISFDQVYGFEYTLLEPQDFWSRVPPQIIPKYHFYNAPVSAKMEDLLSPLRMIKETATPADFVSFKLDIDTPDIEIPIALAILQDSELTDLIDEFFFELHFSCEVMMSCGWKDPFKDKTAGEAEQGLYGLKLDRYSAMDFFQRFRKAGVRAHFWP